MGFVISLENKFYDYEVVKIVLCLPCHGCFADALLRNQRVLPGFSRILNTKRQAYKTFALQWGEKFFSGWRWHGHFRLI